MFPHALLLEGFAAHRARNEHLRLLETHLHRTVKAEADLALWTVVVGALNGLAASVAWLSQTRIRQDRGPHYFLGMHLLK